MLLLLGLLHGISLSIRQVKRILRAHGLRRRDNRSDPRQIYRAVEEELLHSKRTFQILRNTCWTEAIHEMKGRATALKQNNKEMKEIFPFVTQYQPSISNLKEALLKKWHLIQNQPLLRQIFEKPPILSYKNGKSLKDQLVRAKIY